MNLKKINDEVYYSTEKIIKIDKQLIESLKEKAIKNPRKRVRLCAHRDVNDSLHEMLIVLLKDTYVRPHKHPYKIESFHIIEGSVDVAIFDGDGKILDVIRMGDYPSESFFYYRLSDSLFHVPRLNSEYVIIHEITNGPFKKEETIFSSWSPEEDDGVTIKSFMKKISEDIDVFLMEKK